MDAVWVLLLEVAGQRWWAASKPAPLTLGGSRVRVATGLSVDPQPVGVSSLGGSGGATVSLLSPPDMDPPRWWRERVPLDGSRAELSLLLWDGSTAPLERRRVYTSGRVGLPEWGDAGEPLTLSLVPASEQGDTAYPPASRRVSGETWPTAPDSAVGRSYPVVYGVPGAGRATALSGIPDTYETPPLIPDFQIPSQTQVVGAPRATPAIPVQRTVIEINPRPWTSDTTEFTTDNITRLLIADGPVYADTVSIWYRYAESWYLAEDLTVELVQDGLGAAVSTVNISGEYIALRRAQEWWVAWDSGGGAVSESGGLLGTLGQLCLWWLRRSSAPVDIRGCEAAASRLDVYQHDGFTDEPIEPVAWVRDRLRPYPVEVVSGAGGLLLVPVPWRATAADAVARLTVGAGVQRFASVRSLSQDEPLLTARVRFGMQASQETPIGTASATIGSVGQRVHPPEREVQAPETFSSATAQELAAYHLWRGSAGQVEVTLSVAADLWARLRVGDVVLVDDDSLGWSSQVAWVSSVTWTDGPWLSVTVRPIVPLPGVVPSVDVAWLAS